MSSRAEHLARQLVAELRELPFPANRGAATRVELACLYDHLATLGLLEDGSDLAQQQLELAIADLANPAHLLSAHLIGGLPGIGWMLSHLQLADELCGPFDDVLREALAVPRWTADYDLVRGLAGLAMYALARRHVPAGLAIAAAVVSHLEEIAEPTAAGLRWFTPRALLAPEEHLEFPHGRYDLGVAHGAAGAIGALARLAAAGIEAERCARLIDGAVRELLASTPAREPGRFPSCHVPGQPLQPRCRLAWCYGDAGIAVVLMAAARVRSQPAWEREAIELAHRAAARDIGDAGVVQAGICHGYAGLAHMFRRLHAVTGSTELAEAAQRYLALTWGAREPGRGLAGFVTYHHDGTVGDDKDPTVLTGATGNVLVALEAETGVAIPWDDMFLFRS